MMGFIISTLAVGFTAWIVHAATRRAAYLDGIHDANQQWRRELETVRSDDPYIRYIAARFNAGRVPAGTNCGGPRGCDEDCPESQLPRPRINISMPPVRCYGCDCDGSVPRVKYCRDASHVARDDEIYGRNG